MDFSFSLCKLVRVENFESHFNGRYPGKLRFLNMDLWWIMKLSKAMVTGGCGFIGSNLTNWLVTQDCKVVVIDNLVTGKVDNIDVSNPLVTFKHHDLLDPIPISFF